MQIPEFRLNLKIIGFIQSPRHISPVHITYMPSTISSSLTSNFNIWWSTHYLRANFAQGVLFGFSSVILVDHSVACQIALFFGYIKTDKISSTGCSTAPDCHDLLRRITLNYCRVPVSTRQTRCMGYGVLDQSDGEILKLSSILKLRSEDVSSISQDPDQCTSTVLEIKQWDFCEDESTQ